ncbi:TPA: malonate decarboxylase holo-[acyl-carrier-protein] synthase [Salmonella enterica]|nr:malonate decarboxylase holo-[acyl-carrier-protein] synthase [Salmonella enterica]
MKILQRHTLCWLAPSALNAIAEQIDSKFGHLPAAMRREARDYLLSGALPGIVRRGPRNGDDIPLGFCFPMRWHRLRLRMAASAPLKAIASDSTPEQTARLPVTDSTCATRAFNTLRQAWRWPELHFGVWGSVALEIMTPWQWTDSDSDLDIQFTPTSFDQLAQCQATLSRIEQKFQLRIDGEISLPNGYAINIKEWFSGSPTLLAKGENDVQLISRQHVTELSETSFY